MSRRTVTGEDDLLDAILEDERANDIAQLHERRQINDEDSWLSLA